jgi:hypothetical protein
MFGGGGGADQAAQQARFDESARQQRIATATAGINSDFQQFNDAFYNNRANAYSAYATPQLEKQYADARDELTYALSRGGLLNSTEAGRRQADLRTQYDRQRQAIVDQGMTLANQTRGDVENTRSSLISQAGTAADPGSIAATASDRVGVLTANPTFSPLAQLFSNVSGSLAAANRGAGNVTADQLIAAQRSAQATNPYGISSGGGGGGSGHVIR